MRLPNTSTTASAAMSGGAGDDHKLSSLLLLKVDILGQPYWQVGAHELVFSDRSQLLRVAEVFERTRMHNMPGQCLAKNTFRQLRRFNQRFKVYAGFYT